MNNIVINQEDLLSSIERTTDQMFSKPEFIELLSSKKKLRIKYGVDVTAPSLHTGHAVNIWMLRKMQDAGHKVIFLIGDFTTRIGDPSDRDKKRPIISKEQIDIDAAAFIEQAKMVLRFDDPELLEIRRNSEWFETMPSGEFLNLLSMVTQARLISRDMFQKRIENSADIYMHEMVYPIIQGYDSVALESDLTIVGSDQLFNEMMGRFYQEKFGQKPQVIITSTITPGLDGGAKQSKSLGNYVGLAHSPRDKFGKMMRLIDPLLEQYFVVYTDLPMAEIEELKGVIAKDPLAAKRRLAFEIVKRYHGAEAAEEELDWWIKTFSQKNAPEDMPEITFNSNKVKAFDLIRQCLENDVSNSDIRRLFSQGAVELNEITLSDIEDIIEINNGDILKVGKRKWFKIKL